MEYFDDELRKIIYDHTGIILNPNHENHINFFMEERMKKLDLHTFDQYLYKVKNDSTEFQHFINTITINETYFFREQSQFDFLKNYLIEHNEKSPVTIWSAACSSGEEPLSVMALADSLGVKTRIYATDIDTSILARFRKGFYEAKSFRNDGSKFIPLLSSIGNLDGLEFQADHNCISRISINQFNLNNIEDVPFLAESIDIVILRNTLIYFNEELRNRILEKISRILKPEGILLVSMNEIPSINSPNLFTKQKHGDVYFLRKTGEEKNEVKKENPITENSASRIESIARPVQKTEPAAENKLSVSENPVRIPVFMEQKETDMEEIKLLYKNCFKFLDIKDYQKAEETVNSYKFKAFNREYEYYLRGTINLFQKKYQIAGELFERACSMNREFWPAVFLLGYAWNKLENKKKTEECFIRCKKLIEDYNKCEKVCYNFTVATFSPEYFSALCDSFLKFGKEGLNEKTFI